MVTLNPYLNFSGQTEEVFNFYKSVFGGEFTAFQRFKDTPGCDNMPLVEQEYIMHVSLPIGSNIWMGTDVPASRGQVVQGSGISLSISPDNEEETRRIFESLSAGGKVDMPLDKMFWGALFGMFTDKFGVQWMVNYDLNEQK